MNYPVIIPARMASSRLPGKPLIDISGMTMIERTFRQCAKAVPEELIYVATDHQKIYDHCRKKNIQVLMTSTDCLTGTDRVAEVAGQIHSDCYINVQGDEPVMNPDDLREIIKAAGKYPEEIICGYAPIENEEEYHSLSVPKMVFSPNKRLLYTSRNAIPSNKNGKFVKAWRQVCIYAFPKEPLMAFAGLKKKTPLEELEDLELLRFLEMGYSVKMVELSDTSIAVDHPADIEKVVKRLKKLESN